MKKNLFFALVLTSLSILKVNAAEIDLGVGVSHFTNQDGLWYDEPFQHSLKMNSPSFELGVTQNIFKRNKFGLDIRAAYVFLGEVHINAQVPTLFTNTRQGGFVGEDFKGAASSNPCYGTCTNMSEFDGSGHDQGFSITAQPYYMFGDYKVSLIGGVFLHIAKWTENVTGLRDNNGTSYNVNVTNEQSGITVGETAGIAIKKNNLTIKYQYYRTPFHPVDNLGNDSYQPPWHGTHNITFNWSF